MNLPWRTSVLKPSNDPSGSIFIDDMGANRRVDKLLDKRSKIDKEISQIQSECNHKTKMLRMLPNGSCHEVRWVCEDCRLKLGYPTEPEADVFFGRNDQKPIGL